MKTNVDLIHFDFIVAWNYLCSYASTSHFGTQTHTELSDTNAEIHTRTAQLPFFFFWTYHTLQLVGKLKAFLIQKLDVFWYSVNT